MTQLPWPCSLAQDGRDGSPEVTYVISGAYTVHQEGAPDAVRNTGDVGASGNNTRNGHWAENVGTVPAVFIAIDIVKK